MSSKISVDPNKLDELSNELVFKLTDIDEESKQLHRSLASLILSAPPEYAHCFYSVGDPWHTGQALSDRLSEIEQDVRMTANKFAEKDDLLGRMYNIHNKYGTMVAMGGLVSRQLAYYGLGVTQFAKNVDGAYSFRHLSTLGKLSDVVDASKYKRFAKGLLSPTFIFNKYKDTPFADLVHKKYAKYLPGDVVNYSNSSKALWGDLSRGQVKSSVLKNFGDDLVKFGKTNVVSTLVITGATETVGMGLKISENYAKYGNMPDVLKRENAKAVGNAVNKTVFVSGGAIGGAVVGGAIGSLAGPVGTVVGASVGSFVGGLAGEQVAKMTAGFAEKAAIVFETPIQATLDFGKSGIEAAGQAVEGFNKLKDKANEQIKETLNNPIEKVKEIGEGLSKAKDTASSLLKGAKSIFG
ncbi:hypothetical protein [Metabacillus indicus]|uniref:hypothetical protein n=1 Tax=Metabacillus indicus TaxID=246786 RepID=UPI0004931C39|nr:hypothetical protein [Metabacillus indicus]KEZ48154.1 hypothetical protein AZ46_0219525 [Metabacillus indicus LMG 22858]